MRRFIQILEQRRVSLGMARTPFAMRLCGIDKNTYEDYLRGKEAVPHRSTILKIGSRAFDNQVDEQEFFKAWQMDMNEKFPLRNSIVLPERTRKKIEKKLAMGVNVVPKMSASSKDIYVEIGITHSEYGEVIHLSEEDSFRMKFPNHTFVISRNLNDEIVQFEAFCEDKLKVKTAAVLTYLKWAILQNPRLSPHYYVQDSKVGMDVGQLLYLKVLDQESDTKGSADKRRSVIEELSNYELYNEFIAQKRESLLRDLDKIEKKLTKTD